MAASAAFAAACGGSDMNAPLPVTATVSLASGQFVIVGDTLVSGAVAFPAAPAAGAQYLVVGQLATPVAGISAAFSLGGQASVMGAASGLPASAPSVAQAFHDMLRQREAEYARNAWRYAPLLRSPPAAAPPPTVGSKRTFKVCADISCGSTKNVPATAQFVGAHLAIFVDDGAPSGGLNPGDLSQLGQMFDTVLYPIDTDRFGAESDIDGNGVVIVLLTQQVNALIGKPQCQTSFITGYFFGGDIEPGFASQYNSGEIFYGMVPDPMGQVSCAYSTSFVKHIVPVTFVHEFQHMISFNQHVLLRGAQAEILWLNEALSHLAEELGGLHYDSLGIDTTASRFFVGDLFNTYSYLQHPARVAMVTATPPGELDERGAEWLFLRYLVDQFGAGLTRTLAQTSLTGATNIQSASGTPFATLLGRQGLAVYLTDLPGFPAPASLTYAHWSFRTTFASLHQQDSQDFPLAYPLRPDSGTGSQAFTGGTIASGSGAYLLVAQAANWPGFELTFRGANGGALPAQGGAQLAIARIR